MCESSPAHAIFVAIFSISPFELFERHALSLDRNGDTVSWGILLVDTAIMHANTDTLQLSLASLVAKFSTFNNSSYTG